MYIPDTVTQMNTDLSCNTNNKERSRGWCFTINNYDEKDIQSIQQIEGCNYLFQEEKGEKGTPHLQGMLYFENPRTFKSIKKMLPTAHIEKMKNKIASIKYCSKSDTRCGNIYSNFEYIKNDTDDTPKIIKYINYISKKDSDPVIRSHVIKRMSDLAYEECKDLLKFYNV